MSERYAAASPLTPQQQEDVDGGWYTPIVFGPFDFDTLHAALTGPYNDKTTRALWDTIKAQMSAQHFLGRISREIDAIGDGP